MKGPKLPLHRGLKLANIMNLYERTKTYLTIALHGGLYLAIIMDRYEAPQIPLS
jgi:hypothetical protein